MAYGIGSHFICKQFVTIVVILFAMAYGIGSHFICKPFVTIVLILFAMAYGIGSHFIYKPFVTIVVILFAMAYGIGSHFICTFREQGTNYIYDGLHSRIVELSLQPSQSRQVHAVLVQDL